MIKRRVTITIDQTQEDRWRLTGSIAEPYLRGRLVRWMPARTWTRTLSHRYADDLSPKLLTAWIDALTLVAAGYYEDVELPFDTV